MTGGAGAPVTGGAGAPVTGGAGAPAMGGCVAAVGTATDLAIDDLEDGDNAIKVLGQRVGYWYTFNDGTAVQVPAPAVKFTPTMGGHMGMFAATTSGPAFTSYGAGLGFDFNNTAMKSCPYNATAYSGIKFWAKGQRGGPESDGKNPRHDPDHRRGQLHSIGRCDDGVRRPFWRGPEVGADGHLDSIHARLRDDRAGKWGLPAVFNKASILAVQFQVDKALAFDFSIDDVTFY